MMAAAALSRYFPGIEVISAGIQGVEGQRIPQSILDLAETWGLYIADMVSHSTLNMREKLLSSEFIIVAEDEFIAAIVNLGVSPQKILSMQDRRFDHALIPFDPIGQRSQVVSVEIAKAVMTTAQLLRAEEGFSRNFPVDVIFTQDETDFHRKLQGAWVKISEMGGVLLLADFRAPDFSAASQICENILEFRVGRLDQKMSFSIIGEDRVLERALASQKPFAISARFEMDLVEKFVLSLEFIDLVTTLASHGPLLILTEPLGLGSCAYLVAANGNI